MNPRIHILKKNNHKFHLGIPEFKGDTKKPSMNLRIVRARLVSSENQTEV